MSIKKPDKTALREQFEAERQRLAIEFTPQKKSWWMSSTKVTYKTTWEIANTPPYIQKNINSLVVVNEKHSWILMMGFIVFFILTFFANNNLEKDSVNSGIVLFFFFLVLLLGITIIHNVDRSPKIVIDKKGICLCKINLQVTWERIVETYIQEDYNGEDTSYSLYIRYIDDKYLSFETAVIPISGFMQGFEEIAYAIEYIKKNASENQRHFS